MEKREFNVEEEASSMRLDIFLTHKLSGSVSRNTVKKLISQGHVFLNSKVRKPSCKLNYQDKVCVEIPQKEKSCLEAYYMPLNIIYEDDSLLVVDKPTGLSVHPGAGNRNRTLVNVLLSYTQRLSDVDPKRPGIVHRLDKDTSGLLIIARNNQVHLNLTRQFKDRSVKKTYLAIVEGKVQFDEGLVDAPVGPDPRRRKFMKVNFAHKRQAQTTYKVLKRLRNFSVVELSPITGRTHQLRVHMKYLGHPILGDEKYSGRFKFSRLALHAKFIRLRHPETGKIMEFSSSIPREISEFIKQQEKI
ncbi:MAG: RluA family pseudouridine synthase [Candidatus Omnitrophica bacterium]|nr:RluA family pseudouridine synthase [Candidatus Omnitrophota bacterium]